MRLFDWITGRRAPTLAALIALVAGMALGIALALTDLPALRLFAAVVKPLGQVWVNAIRMVLIPLVVSLLIVGVAAFHDVRALGRVGAKAVGIFLALLAGAAVFSALVGPPLFEGLRVDSAAVAALRAAAAPVPASAELPTLGGFLVGLVPSNPVRAAADGAMLPLIVFTLLFALGTTRLPEELRATITTFFRGVSEVMLALVRWILLLTPLGVFALSVDLGASLGLDVAGAVGYYVLVLCAMLTVTTLALYPVVALAGGVSLARFARAAAPAQAVAVGTRSSLASLPALIEGARRVFGDRPAISGFVLPLAVSTFKFNTPVSDLVGPLFLAALYGFELTAAQVVTMTAVAVAMSFSNPGIPSGGLFVVTAPVMLSVGLPIEGIAILIAADAIPDIFATVANVTGDMTTAALLIEEA